VKKSISNKQAGRSGVAVMGIDLGDRVSRYAVIDEGGELIAEQKVATDRKTMGKLLAMHPRMRVVVETGTHSPWVSRLAEAAGHEVVVANARKVKLITANRRKRDRVDAAYLARLGRTDVELLHPVRHRTEATQRDRAWLLARDAAVGARTQLINHVRGVVKSLGGRLPACSADAFARRVKTEVPKPLRSIVGPLLSVIEQLTETIHGYERSIAVMVQRRHPAVERLEQVPGVGLITATAYVLTLEDPRRFATSRTVGAYLGLVPAMHESGEQMPQMRITKEGDVMLRRLLVNAAHHILGPFGRDSALRRHGQRIAARGATIARKRAVVAVARKLAVVLHRLWISGADYDPLHGLQTAAPNNAPA
jgi:transposase